MCMWYDWLASPVLQQQGPQARHSVQIIAITFFSKILHYVGELFMQFRERVTDLVLRHARFSLLLSGEPGTAVWVSISTLSLFESIGLLTLSKHLSLSGTSHFRIFISCLKSVDGRREYMIYFPQMYLTLSWWLQTDYMISKYYMFRREATFSRVKNTFIPRKSMVHNKWYG